ncbi:MAG: hypothetical protein FJZ66_03345 [Bacteroidetes bacterium]|nr:hypothetical protein [Bacteroidota bacterium]
MKIKTNDMKKSIKFIGAALFVSSLITSCGNESQSSESANKSNTSVANNQNNSQKQDKQNLDSINKALSEIKVSIYNHDAIVYDSEGWIMMEDNSAKIKEVKDFNSTKSFACKKGNYIQKLTIEGVFNGIDIKFLDAKDNVVQEFKKYNLQNSISYSDVDYQPVNQVEKERKDKFYQPWFEKANKIQLIYNDSIFYTGTWKSNGHFIQ